MELLKNQISLSIVIDNPLDVHRYTVNIKEDSVLSSLL